MAVFKFCSPIYPPHNCRNLRKYFIANKKIRLPNIPNFTSSYHGGVGLNRMVYKTQCHINAVCKMNYYYYAHIPCPIKTRNCAWPLNGLCRAEMGGEPAHWKHMQPWQLIIIGQFNCTIVCVGRMLSYEKRLGVSSCLITHQVQDSCSRPNSRCPSI